MGFFPAGWTVSNSSKPSAVPIAGSPLWMSRSPGWRLVAGTALAVCTFRSCPCQGMYAPGQGLKARTRRARLSAGWLKSS